MRCPDCNRFVSFDEPEIEWDVEVNQNNVGGNVRIALPCAECGAELKEANLDFSLDIEHECDPEVYATYVKSVEELGQFHSYSEEDDPEYEITSEDFNATDRYEDKDKNGKTIKNSRYMKHFYGADILLEIVCLKCGEVIEVQELVEEQASGFEEC